MQCYQDLDSRVHMNGGFSLHMKAIWIKATYFFFHLKGDLLPIEGVETNLNNLSKGSKMFENYRYGEDIGITPNMLEAILSHLPNCDLKEELERKLALYKCDNSIEDYLNEQRRLTDLMVEELVANGTVGSIDNFPLPNLDFGSFPSLTDFLPQCIQLMPVTNLTEIQKKLTRKSDRRLLKRLPWKAEDKEKVFAEIGSSQIPKMPDIKALRKREGLSQNDFARIYAINLANIRAWERGKEASPLACAYMRLIELWPNLVRDMLGLQV